MADNPSPPESTLAGFFTFLGALVAAGGVIAILISFTERGSGNLVFGIAVLLSSLFYFAIAQVLNLLTGIAHHSKETADFTYGVEQREKVHRQAVEAHLCKLIELQETANLARAESNKAMQWMIDNWRSNNESGNQ